MTIVAPEDVLPSGSLLIDGERVTGSSGGVFEHVYAATGKTNARIELAGKAEIDRAVASSWRAQREWRRGAPRVPAGEEHQDRDGLTDGSSHGR